MDVKVTASTRTIIEQELRRGTSKSRIANILEVDYAQGLDMIEKVKESIRPDIGDKITFTFRNSQMKGIITKLLSNSAVVDIYWEESDLLMKDICEDKTIVNFKDIKSFVNLPPQKEDEDLRFDE
ncbi:DUF2187 family protein [Fundicoccus culcitae]|uniref:YkvS family protein n=1 Tax=Fundicoccus culcitae TaxID=2969821 RepID=A0ABY5P6W0_9LACT|nr:DUF2187 family protein [Fundicoccus culcitae]UUX34321.1 YkvS family protein [Fundicoccus culcitae]